MATSIRLESASDDPSDAPTDLTTGSSLVVFTFTDSYLKTFPGAVKFLQIVLAVIILVCVTSSGSSSAGSYLYLPLSWHLRVYVFVNVFAMFISLFTLLLHITSLIDSLPINWDLFDLIAYSLLAFSYLFGASLVASAVDIYQKLNKHVSSWSKQQLIISIVFGYFGVFLYGITALMAFRRFRGLSQFGSRKFSTSQLATSSNE